MPQMAPLMWLYLYCFFLLSLIILYQWTISLNPMKKLILKLTYFLLLNLLENYS